LVHPKTEFAVDAIRLSQSATVVSYPQTGFLPNHYIFLLAQHPLAITSVLIQILSEVAPKQGAKFPIFTKLGFVQFNK
jgi:hypothetical protein